jgi:hypothetical protein
MTTGRPDAAGLRIEPGLDGTRYILPARSREQCAKLGLVFLVVGLFVGAFMFFWMSMPIGSAFDTEGPMRWFLLLFGLMGLPGLLVGLGLMVGGVGLLTGASRCEVTVAPALLAATEVVGFIRWTKRRPVQDIERFVVGTKPKLARRSGTSSSSLEANMILAEGEDMKDLWIAPGYSDDLTHELLGHLRRAVAHAEVEIMPLSGEVVDEGARADLDGGPEPAVIRPAGSDIVIEEQSSGTTLIVPPAGLIKGSKGLFLMSVIWLLFCGGIFGFVLKESFSGSKGGETGMVVLMALVFVGAGVVMLLCAINMGRRRVLLVASKELLAYRRMGPFGTREQKMHTGDLAAIRVGPSGMTINDKPVMELQIHTQSGRKRGLLSQRKLEELEWIAFELRQATGLPGQMLS